MSNPPMKRSSLTEYLVGVAQSLPVPVGRGSAPQGGGWSGQGRDTDRNRGNGGQGGRHAGQFVVEHQLSPLFSRGRRPSEAAPIRR